MDIALSMENYERELIRACLRKERAAQKELYEAFHGKMLGVCMRYAIDREQARDILNEGFIKVFKNLNRYKIGTSLESWIRRIMINTAIDCYRKNVRHRTEDIEHARAEVSKEADAVSRCSAKEILAMVQQLPPSYRTVFNLYAIEGFSHKEVAKKMGISESTSRSNLVKARNKLKDLLKAKQAYEYGK